MSNYDQPIASIYKDIGELLPYRMWAEPYSLKKVIGKIDGLDVLDAACGTGIITRLMAKSGAVKVTGIDISEAMIAQAKTVRSSELIHYLTVSMESYTAETLHDLVVSSFLFNEARDINHLESFCRSIHRNLKPNRKVVVLMDMLDKAQEYDYSHYGFQHIIPNDRSLQEGERFLLNIDINGSMVTLNLRHYSSERVQEALLNSGFENIEFHSFDVPEEARSVMPTGYWNTMLNHPCMIIVSAIKI